MVVAFVAAGAVTVGAGITNAYGTGDQFQVSIGDWPDGATTDTFWDAQVVDIPGLSVFAVHCVGRVHFDLQYGTTGPSHSNACYASLGVYTGATQQLDAYMLLPVGSKALYRCSTNDRPWIYYFGDVIYAPAPSTPGELVPRNIFALGQGHCDVP